ncbi:MAG: cation diffusion facilitator family transporter [Halioglobus sp.]|nr:cation diffusion facilitator family transporter [Halioglobus sp.]
MTDQSADSDQLPRREVARQLRLVTRASLAVALILILAKTAAWGLTGAVSLLATLVDSCLDALASLVNLLAVRHALSPADREHRFGHGKAEALSGLGQSLLIVGSGLFLLYESAARLQEPVAPTFPAIGIAVMLLSIALTLVLVSFQRRVVRRTGSTAVRADALHYRADLLVNVAVIAALLLAHRGWPGFDALAAIGIALYILFSAWQIVRQSLNHLMDRELPDAQREKIVRIVDAHPDVMGMHELRSRRSGTDMFIQLHLELDDNLTLVEAHRISDEVESALRAELPRAEILIHTDPSCVVAAELDRQRR